MRNHLSPYLILIAIVAVVGYANLEGRGLADDESKGLVKESKQLRDERDNAGK